MHLIDITMFYAAEGGGVSTYLNAKARWLAQRQRVRHSILSPSVETHESAPGSAPALVRLPGVAMPGLNGYRMPRSVGAPARILQRLQPDLVEAGDAGHCAWAALRIKRRLGIPAVAFYHSDVARLVHERFGRLAMLGTQRYLCRLYRQFDLVLAPSRLMVQQLAAMGVHGALHQPLGVDPAIFHPAIFDPASAAPDSSGPAGGDPARPEPANRAGAWGAQLRAQLKLPPGTRLLVYAGRFTAQKKLDLLIGAVRALGRPYHLLLVGGGAALPPCAQATVLSFKRDQRQLARLLASCDVLVHPGDCETFGLIVLEAMGCGLPVVATSGGALAELLDDATGIVVAPNSVAGLCAGIDAIYRRDLDAMSRAATRKAHQQYAWDCVLPQLMHRYADLLATRERADLEAGRRYAAE